MTEEEKLLQAILDADPDGLDLPELSREDREAMKSGGNDFIERLLRGERPLPPAAFRGEGDGAATIRNKDRAWWSGP